MSAVATVTVEWTEVMPDGQESWDVAGVVTVTRGREQVTFESERLVMGTLELARELASAREKRRMHQVGERFQAASTPFGLQRRVIREYQILGLVT